MHYLLVAALLIFNLSQVFSEPVQSGSQKSVVYVFPVKENIGPGIWRQMIKAFSEADSLKADVILLHMNTYGGTVLDADSMRTKVLNSRIPVYVFIDNNAASAGALISIACDSIYMREGANMGAATVVNETGQAMPDKYQSYMRSIMRSTAEAQGKHTVYVGKDTLIKWRRDPKIAEAMVDPDVYIKGIIDTGKVLTMTPAEAIKYGFCEGVRKDIHEVIEKAGFKNYQIREYRATGLDRVIGFLVNPFVSGILIMAIIGGIYFEMQTPGIVFPIGVAIGAAILYFAPLYLEGLAANWEIIIFIIGIILLAIEIMIIPGFGVFGILGIVLMVSGLILSLLNNVIFDFDGVEPTRLSTAVGTVLTAIILAFSLSVWTSSKLFTSGKGIFRNFALHTSLSNEPGDVGVDRNDASSLIGKSGVAQTVLRLSGKVSVEGNVYDAMSEGTFIDKGEKVRITRHEAGQVYVVREIG
jgi:membrane-bound serine protease (ClpP class)